MPPSSRTGEARHEAEAHRRGGHGRRCGRVGGTLRPKEAHGYVVGPGLGGQVVARTAPGRRPDRVRPQGYRPDRLERPGRGRQRPDRPPRGLPVPPDGRRRAHRGRLEGLLAPPRARPRPAAGRGQARGHRHRRCRPALGRCSERCHAEPEHHGRDQGQDRRPAQGRAGRQAAPDPRRPGRRPARLDGRAGRHGQDGGRLPRGLLRPGRHAVGRLGRLPPQGRGSPHRSGQPEAAAGELPGVRHAGTWRPGVREVLPGRQVGPADRGHGADRGHHALRDRRRRRRERGRHL
jgi:hypothetical protein